MCAPATFDSSTSPTDFGRLSMQDVFAAFALIWIKTAMIGRITFECARHISARRRSLALEQ
ncbi:MAG: hypothetical protein CVT83_00965 [Alphaproteobacteria bacterium HGW-Alphaproteobacteria-5]|nr:MAG: hypothetical protein CVT83_00965 [Alphaproteobacteria bacterium HGW-Alphaproteobacteria-5]